MKKHLLFLLLGFSIVTIAFSQCPPPLPGYLTIPYSTGFESGIDPNFTLVTQNGSAIIHTQGYFNTSWGTAAPHTGTWMMGMHQPNGGNYAQNEVWIKLDLCGKSSVYFDFWWMEWNDESEVQDGIFFSDNGGSSFTKVHNLPGASYTDLTWQHFVLNVDSLCNVHGLTMNSTFVIKLQQYDDYYFNGGNDGHFYDDISIYSLNVIDTNVGVTQLVVPGTSCGNTDDTLRIEVTNFGIEPLSNIPVQYSVNNGPFLPAGTITGPLASNQSAVLTVTGLPYSGVGTFLVKARTVFTGDTVPGDDLDSVTYQNNPVPSQPVASNVTVCYGNPLQISATGGPFLDWRSSPNGSVIFTGSTYAPPSNPGNYTFYVNARDSIGCLSAQTMVAATVTPPMQVSVLHPGVNSLCPGTTLTTGVVGNYSTYQWNSGQTTAAITVSSGGLYYVEVTDVNGCIGFSDTVTVSMLPAPPVPAVSANPGNMACAGDSILLISSISSNIVWNDVQQSTSQSIYVHTSGTYSVTHTANSGCQSVSQPVTVTFTPAPQISFAMSLPSQFCAGDTLDLDGLASPAGGTWSGPSVSNDMFMPVTPGNVTLMYSYTDNNGCSGTGTHAMQVVACQTGIQELPAGTYISHWPVPATDFLNIRYELGTLRGFAEIRDMSGKMILRSQEMTGNGQSQLPVQSLAAGTYLIVYYLDGYVVTDRFIKI